MPTSVQLGLLHADRRKSRPTSKVEFGASTSSLMSQSNQMMLRFGHGALGGGDSAGWR